jgi:hypothetical protein
MLLKALNFIMLPLLMFIASCSQVSPVQPQTEPPTLESNYPSTDTYYYNLLYSRDGSGEKMFYITPASEHGAAILQLSIIRYNGSDTLDAFYLYRDSTNVALFALVEKALSRKDTVAAAAAQSTATPQQHVWAIDINGNRAELADSQILKSLEVFEPIVDKFMTGGGKK